MLKIFKRVQIINHCQSFYLSSGNADFQNQITENMDSINNLVQRYRLNQDQLAFELACQQVKDSAINIQYFDKTQLQSLSQNISILNFKDQGKFYYKRYKIRYTIKDVFIIKKKINRFQNQIFDYEKNDLNLFNKLIEQNIEKLNQVEIINLVYLYSNLYQDEHEHTWRQILNEASDIIPNMSLKNIHQFLDVIGKSVQNEYPQNNDIWDIIVQRLKETIPYELQSNQLPVIVQTLSFQEIQDQELWDLLYVKTLQFKDQLAVADIARILEGVKLNTKVQQFFINHLEPLLINKMDNIELQEMICLISAFAFSQQGSSQTWYILDQHLQKYINQMDSNQYIILLFSILGKNTFLQKSTTAMIYEKYSQYMFSADEKKILQQYLIENNVEPIIIDTYFKDLTSL